MSGPKVETWEANLMQMKINTRLTALQTALELMKMPAYTEQGNKTDHITLLAMAGDVGGYIIDDLAAEARKAIDAAKNPGSRILQVR